MKYRNGYSSHWERQFTCPRSLSYWRKWALHEERYILHVSYLKKKKNSLSRHWSTADYEARTITERLISLYWLVNSKLSVESAIFPSRVEVLTLPYMVWRVWLTEILETFPRVFRFEKSRIKENGGNKIVEKVVLSFYLGHVFGIWEVFLDSGKCFGFLELFWILGSVFGFWKVFRILGIVLDSGKCFWILGSCFGF